VNDMKQARGNWHDAKTHNKEISHE
jgi:hypothetical protein